MKLYLNILLILSVLIAGCADNPTDPESSEDAIEIPEKLKCSDGLSNEKYSCENIDLVAHVPVEELLTEPLDNGKALNDIWGWTDPQTGIEYALVGLTDGVAFVDISTPSDPEVVAKLNETTSSSKSTANNLWKGTIAHDEKSAWRDFKVYENYLYVVSDAQPHGLQVFDLTRLRDIDDPPAMLREDVLYEEFENAHNIAINTETGFAYIGGSDTYGGGLHIVDIQDPLNPEFAGFHSDSTVGRNSTGYVHDMQCVSYQGPDADYQSDEICMNSSETHLVIANVTDKEHTSTISKVTYEGNAYAHQGWLTEDHRYFLLDDESDEHQGINTRTYIWDVQNLDDPKLIDVYQSSLTVIDHNQFVKGDYVYQANYTSGLRILNLENIIDGILEEVAHFDTFPAGNRLEFDGAWSNYPYFESGVVIVSDITNGLFILKPNLE
jgi:choice-of-anchor B domain-containing protein